MTTIVRGLWWWAWLSGMPLAAENLSWFSDAMKVNLDSSGAAMDAGFQFELGVFSDGFSPTARNTGEWQAHWVAADSETYNTANQRFAGLYTVSDNPAPFTAGAAGWIFGHRDSPTGSSWILLRKSSWLWPAPNPMNPVAVEWNVKDADLVVLGAVNESGSPFLMQSAALQTFTQWQTEHLSGEPLDGPNDDPDLDGTPNLLEFVFGTSPNTAGAPTVTPVDIDGGHLRITIPRRMDHPAELIVEVSDDLENWFFGSSYTEVASDDPVALVVRDLTVMGPAHPKRFIRLRAVLP